MKNLIRFLYLKKLSILAKFKLLFIIFILIFVYLPNILYFNKLIIMEKLYLNYKFNKNKCLKFFHIYFKPLNIAYLFNKISNI